MGFLNDSGFSYVVIIFCRKLLACSKTQMNSFFFLLGLVFILSEVEKEYTGPEIDTGRPVRSLDLMDEFLCK